MSVHAKLAKARNMLSKSNLKKTGKGHNFIYFELGDFLPRIIEIFDEVGLSSTKEFSKEGVKLFIYDTDDETVAEFSLPYGTFKGDEKRNLQAIQELGSETTYLTRYLWVLAMDIVEPDTIDRSKDTQQTTQTQHTQNVVQPQHEVKEEKPVYDDDRVFWDGHSPLKEFDHFVVEQPDGTEIVYKTMRNKTKGNLFGLAVEPADVPGSLKYYSLD